MVTIRISPVTLRGQDLSLHPPVDYSGQTTPAADAPASPANGSRLPFQSSIYPRSGAQQPSSASGEFSPGRLGDVLTPASSNAAYGDSRSTRYTQPGVNQQWSSQGTGSAGIRDVPNPFFRSSPQEGAAAGMRPATSEWPELDRDMLRALDELDDEPESGTVAEEIPAGQKRTFETSGKVETIRQHYDDGTVQVERQVTQDRDGNYFSHGTWKLFSPQKQTLADGTFQFGMMEGPWRRWHPASKEGVFSMQPFEKYDGPFLSTVNFNAGRMDGIWQIHDSRQNKIMEIPYELGRRQGTATWWWPNGQKMREIRFDRNLIDGYWMEWDERGEVARRDEYIRGRKLIRETEEYRPGQRRSMAWFADAKLKMEGLDNWWEASPAAYVSLGEKVQHGPVALWYENGQPLMQGQYIANQQHGEFTWWHANGQKKLAGQFDRGKKTGLWTWWHESGMKSNEGSYVGDQPQGMWLWWDTDGKVTQRRVLGTGHDSASGPQPPVDSTESNHGNLPPIQPGSGVPDDDGIDDGMEDITPSILNPNSGPPKIDDATIPPITPGGDGSPETINIAPDPVIPLVDPAPEKDPASSPKGTEQTELTFPSLKNDGFP